MRRSSFPLGLIVGAVAMGMLMIASPLVATKPTTPYDLLEQRAAKKGAGAVRTSYQHDIEAIVSSLNAKQGASLPSSLKRTFQIEWLFDYLGSWALVEAREIRQKRAAVDLKETVFEPMLRAAEDAMSAYREEVPRLMDLKGKAPRPELERLGIANTDELAWAHDRDVALRRIALLFKLAGARQPLNNLFSATRLPIDGAVNPQQFLAYPHKYDELLGINLR